MASIVSPATLKQSKGKGLARMSSIERLKLKTAEYHFEKGDLEQALKVYRELLSSHRPTMRQKAATFIIKREDQLRIAQQDRESEERIHTVNITIEGQK